MQTTRPNSSSRMSFFFIAMVIMMVMQYYMMKTQTKKLSEQQPPPAAVVEPAGAVTPAQKQQDAKRAATVLAEAREIFPAEVAKDLVVADPIWANLQPTEQIAAMRTRLDAVGKDPINVGPLALTIGYLYEAKLNNPKAAAAEYNSLSRFTDPKNLYEYSGQALLRAAELYQQVARANDSKDARKSAHRALDAIVAAEQRSKGALQLWGRRGEPGVAKQAPGDAPFVLASDPYKLVLWRIDEMSRDQFVYKIIAGLVRVCGNKPGISHVLALLLLAFILNLATFPLSRVSYRSMREMSKVQPLIKQLQTRYKDDPQRLNAAMMAIYKEHGVNPMAGCWPMLIQMPVFIFVYQGIRAYTYHFHGAQFMWIKSLAMTDLPLLIIYAISMFFTQRLMMATQPAMDAQQAQMQKTMSWMMPILFTVMMYSWNLPSAFYFYWIAFNIMSTTTTMINKRTLPPLEVPTLALSTAEPAPLKAAAGATGGIPRAKQVGPAGRAAGKGKKKGKH